MSTIALTSLTPAILAKTIDHSLLRPELTLDEVLAGCDLAAKYNVASVCARPSDVVRCVARLAGTTVAVGTTIGFPHGVTTTAAKVAEAKEAVANGAKELDMVLNIGALKSGDFQFVEADIRAVVEAGNGALVKVILENAYLTDAEKVKACQLVEAAGGHFVKTSTGFAPTGATVEDLRLMRATVSDHVEVKAAAGIRTLPALLAVIEAGAIRVGATATAVMLDDFAIQGIGAVAKSTDGAAY